MKKLSDNIYVRALVETLIIFVFSLILGGAITVFCSCRTCKPQKEYVTEVREVVRGDTNNVVKIRVDSIRVTDSIVTLIKGDTVITDRWHTAYRDRLRVDTVEKIKLQTVYLTKTETKEVPVSQPLPAWKNILAVIGGLSLLLIMLIYLFRRFFKS